MGSVIVFSTKKQRKRLQTPVNHEFTGVFILAEMQKNFGKQVIRSLFGYF